MSEIFVNFRSQTVQMGPKFSLTLGKLSVLLHCHALHTVNRTQPNFAKREEVNGADASE